MYSNCCCSRSFEREIIKIGQSSHKMYSNNIVNFQESMTILNASTKKSGNLLNVPCIWPIDRTQSGATTPSQSGSRSNGNEGVFYILEISKAGASSSDCLMSYPGHSLERVGSYSTTEMQLVYSTAQPTGLKLDYKFKESTENLSKIYFNYWPGYIFF